MNYQYEILYIVQGSGIVQQTIITATDAYVARRIFQQQNPQCKITGGPREVYSNGIRQTGNDSRGGR